MTKVAVYPGSFDPITHGHIDIIKRAANLFDTVVVAISNNTQKKHLFTHAQRENMAAQIFKGHRTIKVDRFDGLLVDYLKKKKIRAIIRGLRAVSDLDYEFQMAAMNRSLLADIETIFFMPSEKYTYLSSSLVREVAAMKGNLKPFVSANVASALKRKYHA